MDEATASIDMETDEKIQKVSWLNSLFNGNLELRYYLVTGFLRGKGQVVYWNK
jgi:hypothetical protein